MEKKMSLIEGEGKYICTCGKSGQLPICDGSHKPLNESEGSNYRPVKVVSDGDVSLNLESGGWPGDDE